MESLRDFLLEEGGAGGLEADKRGHSSVLSHFQGCDPPQEMAHLAPAFNMKLTYRARLLAEGKSQPAPGEQPEAVVSYILVPGHREARRRVGEGLGGDVDRPWSEVEVGGGAARRAGASVPVGRRAMVAAVLWRERRRRPKKSRAQIGR